MLLPYPCHQHVHDVVDLPLRQFFPLLDVRPFEKTASATRACRMLRLEDRVSMHRRLFAIVWDGGGSKPFKDEVIGVLLDDVHALLVDVFVVFPIEMKAGTE